MSEKKLESTETPKKESDVEKFLKIKAAYDLHTIASDVRAKQEAIADQKFKEMVDKIELEDYCTYLEKYLYPEFKYQKEKGGRNFTTVMIFISALELSAFLVLPVVWQTVFAATMVFIVSCVAVYQNFLGIHGRYKDIWKDGEFENSNEALKQIRLDAYEKSTQIGYKIFNKVTSSRRIAELEKASKWIA